jgi:hypothetical protein
MAARGARAASAAGCIPAHSAADRISVMSVEAGRRVRIVSPLNAVFG